MTLEEQIKHFPDTCGVYQMFDADQSLLYVGKAKSLKKRVASYFGKRAASLKERALVRRIDSIQVTVTATEVEALILEQNLIKQQRPFFNILLRDDKSYPYIYLSDDPYPRLTLHRGKKRLKGHYFGPYPNVGAVRETLNILQKTFKVRQCENSYFNNRTRPCLEYQLQRCKAPCVGLISTEDYSQDVALSIRFLKGDDKDLIDDLARAMNRAADTLEYETALALREQIQQLRKFQSEQRIEQGQGDMDVIAVAESEQVACVHILFIRTGRVMGSRSYYPKNMLVTTEVQTLEQFLPQYYLVNTEQKPPKTLVVGHQLDGGELFLKALKQATGRKISLQIAQRGRLKSWMQLATQAAEQNLSLRLASRHNYQNRWQDLQKQLALDSPIQQMEAYDISHTQGALTVASCVVFNRDGPANSLYRRYNIKGITPGDDLTAMQQVLRRRFQRRSGKGQLPDLVIIDGGKGQLAVALDTLNELELPMPLVISIAKGPERKSGEETLYCGPQACPLNIDPKRPAFHLLQQIRDEAHRFAIRGHRQRRAKSGQASVLSQIKGVGPQRRKTLLQHFGGLQQLVAASISDLSTVKGISRSMAEHIYQELH